MWTPAERIRHQLPVLSLPSVADAQSSMLFSPLTLPNGLKLRDRTWVPAMVPWRATEAGEVTDHVLDWYGRFARGKPGAIVVEATGIRDVPSGPLLRIGHDRFVAGLARLAEHVRQQCDGETRLFIQLIDFLRIRRRPDPNRFLAQFLPITQEHRAALSSLGRVDAMAGEAEVRRVLAELDPSALQLVLSERELEALERGARDRVTDLHLPEVLELPQVLPTMFADAAARAVQAGFDGVELHYAHAYTMASFLSAHNTRTDGYGGDRYARVRLPLEVYRAVRGAVPGRFAVGCRFLCDEIIEGGTRPTDAAHFGVAFAEAGMDYLSLSTGGKFEDAKQPKIGEAAYPYTGQSGYECMPTTLSDARGPFARNIAPQAYIRQRVREAGYATPIIVAGGINDFEQAESILQEGRGDVIGAARQSMADPDWFQKLRTGHASEIRRCTYRNYCEGLDQKHRMVTCQRWDREGLDMPNVRTTDGGRRRTTAPEWTPRS